MAARSASKKASGLLDRDEQDRVAAAFGEDTFRRLRTIKALYDPDNVFRLNHNIRPPDRALGAAPPQR
jgi:FAD/FMN-containing dehydrogenase